MHTTFALLKAHRACAGSYRKLRKAYTLRHGPIKNARSEVHLSFILEVLGPADTLWALPTVVVYNRAEAETLARDTLLWLAHWFSRKKFQNLRVSKAEIGEVEKSWEGGILDLPNTILEDWTDNVLMDLFDDLEEIKKVYLVLEADLAEFMKQKLEW
jgi:hypothetical protein